MTSPAIQAYLHQASDLKSRMTAKNAKDLLCCGNCGKDLKDSKPKRCSVCRMVCYCNKECQQANWKVHKKTCAADAASTSDVASTSDGPSRPTPDDT